MNFETLKRTILYQILLGVVLIFIGLAGNSPYLVIIGLAVLLIQIFTKAFNWLHIKNFQVKDNVVPLTVFIAVAIFAVVLYFIVF